MNCRTNYRKHNRKNGRMTKTVCLMLMLLCAAVSMSACRAVNDTGAAIESGLENGTDNKNNVGTEGNNANDNNLNNNTNGTNHNETNGNGTNGNGTNGSGTEDGTNNGVNNGTGNGANNGTDNNTNGGALNGTENGTLNETTGNGALDGNGR